jgi:hypothetical protein
MVNTVFQQRRYYQYKDTSAIPIPVIPHAHDDTKEELIKFDILKKHVLDTLETYAIFFRDGEFDELRDGINHIDPLSEFMLRTENFELSHKEYMNYEFEDDLVEQYKSFLFIVVDEFKQVLQLTNLNDNLQRQVDTLRESDRTLKNLDLLKEFIKKYYGGSSVSLFETEYVVPPLQIKTEFLIYLQRHGVPPDSIFESEKMAIIKMELYGTTVTDTSTSLGTSLDCESNNPVVSEEKLCITDTNHHNSHSHSHSHSHSDIDKNKVLHKIERLDKTIELLKKKLENENDCSMTEIIEIRISKLEARRDKLKEQCDSSI